MYNIIMKKKIKDTGIKKVDFIMTFISDSYKFTVLLGLRIIEYGTRIYKKRLLSIFWTVTFLFSQYVLFIYFFHILCFSLSF